MVKRVITVLVLLLTVLWLGFIFSNSLRDAEASRAQSEQVQQVVNEVIETLGGEGDVPQKTVRKSAHFVEFFILGVLLTADALCLLSFKRPMLSFCVAWLSLGMAALLGILSAVADELIQLTSAGRACDWRDMLTDALGTVSGASAVVAVVLVCCLVMRGRRASHREEA